MALTGEEPRGSIDNQKTMYLEFFGARKEFEAIEAELSGQFPKYLSIRKSFAKIPLPVVRAELIHQGQTLNAHLNDKSLIVRHPRSKRHDGSFGGVKIYCDIEDASFSLNIVGNDREEAEENYAQIIRGHRLNTIGSYDIFKESLTKTVSGVKLNSEPICYRAIGKVSGINPRHTMAEWETFRDNNSRSLIGPLTLTDFMGDIITQRCPYRD